MADDVTGAVRRTPRPTGDHQTPETGAQESAGTTNTASPVSGDQLDVSSRVSSQDDSGGLKTMLVELIDFSRDAAEGWHLWNFGHAADAIINAGWRPPREDPGALAELRAKLAEDPDSILFPGPECDMEAYAALPPCTACEGSGQDTHGTVFEPPLAVHFAGPPVRAERRHRQLCMWCGHVLVDITRGVDERFPEVDSGDWPIWPVGALVRVEDGLATRVPHTDGGELPPGCCALPDDEEPRGYGEKVCRHCDVQAAFCPCPKPDVGCGKHVPGTSSNRCLLPADHAGECDDDPPKPGPGCYPPADGWDGVSIAAGPDEAQETRAAADWPPEPVDMHEETAGYHPHTGEPLNPEVRRG